MSGGGDGEGGGGEGLGGGGEGGGRPGGGGGESGGGAGGSGGGLGWKAGTCVTRARNRARLSVLGCEGHRGEALRANRDAHPQAQLERERRVRPCVAHEGLGHRLWRAQQAADGGVRHEAAQAVCDGCVRVCGRGERTASLRHLRVGDGDLVGGGGEARGEGRAVELALRRGARGFERDHQRWRGWAAWWWRAWWRGRRRRSQRRGRRRRRRRRRVGRRPRRHGRQDRGRRCLREGAEK